MKKFLAVIAPLFLLFNSCNKPYMALRFAEFTVGEDLNDCYSNAVNDTTLFNLTISEEDDWSSATFETLIPNYNYPDKPDFALPLEGTVLAYKGQIYRIIILSRNSFAREAIPSMYEAKYGVGKKKKDKLIWRFSNGTISIVELTHNEKRKRLIDNWEKYHFRVLDSYYEEVDVVVFDKVGVYYSSSDAEKILRKRSAYLEQQYLAQEKAWNEEKEREEASIKAKEQEEARQKAQAQQGIVSTIAF